MAQQKAAALILCSSVLMSLLYYNYYDRDTIRVIDVNTIEAMYREPIYLYSGSDAFLINTTGCKIPNYGKTLKLIESKYIKQSCDQRAIFVQKINNNQIIFRIDTNEMRKYLKKIKKYECCYKFASRSKTFGKEDTALSYTPCKPFINGSKTELLQEVVTVTCVSLSKMKSNVFYKDAYIIVKKQTPYNDFSKENKQKWNVLLLGMDTMSRARIFSSMPKTVKYLQKHSWLDYKGYNKVGSNTFPNIMSILTGINLSTIYSACRPNMYTCNDLMIWSKFRKAGYITAYGEDNLKLPDTFYGYNGFESIPTHHYMRPFFLTGEYQRGNLVCTGSHPSGKHILDYAHNFADTYKNEEFFGLFWINSYSHNLVNKPSLFEEELIDFFEKFRESSWANNTFIVFLSDHGIRFGPTRLPMESYYEERLPMLFMWVPNEFKKRHEEEFYNLQLNQNRLITPYDLHVTLMNISNMSVNSTDITAAAACPSCKSLFEKISTHKTCAEAGISELWCSCHSMKIVDNNTDKDATNSLQMAVAYVQDQGNKIETINCTKCALLQLDSIIRTHMYTDGNKTYYVVAFQMNPGHVVYEATVLKDDNRLTILEKVETLSGYNAYGKCAKKEYDRKYCVCKNVKCTR